MLRQYTHSVKCYNRTMTVIRNATILPMTEKNLFFRGDISIKDGKIFRSIESIGYADEASASVKPIF